MANAKGLEVLPFRSHCHLIEASAKMSWRRFSLGHIKLIRRVAPLLCQHPQRFEFKCGSSFSTRLFISPKPGERNTNKKKSSQGTFANWIKRVLRLATLNFPF